ncbi:Rha family transcriptional regulator [Escherichia coli]|nr:Rha family transcriptional regulator [Escherichia coli]EJH6316426.1 Rha family transcriptional regulator [Escherichia coli]
MNNLVALDGDGRLMADSRDVAERFGKRHADVIRAIENICKQEPFAKRNFELCFEINELQNGKRQKFYKMTRDGFTLLAMGFTGKEALSWKIKYIEAFNEMERIIKDEVNAKPLTFTEQCNELIATIKSEKDLASKCGTALAKWKKVKKQRIEEIKDLERRAQLELF